MKEIVTFSRVNFVEQAEAIERILQAGVKKFFQWKNFLGFQFPSGDGKVVIVPPEEIVISPEPTDSEE